VKHHILRTLGQAKRLIVIVIGFTILAAGIAMIVLPGPAVIVIPGGLAILATEFVWARKLLDNVKERIHRLKKMKRKTAQAKNSYKTNTTSRHMGDSVRREDTKTE